MINLDLIAFSQIDVECINFSELPQGKRSFLVASPFLCDLKHPTYGLETKHGVCVVRPYLPLETSVFERKEMMLELLKELIVEKKIYDYNIWTDTCKTMPFVRNLSPLTITYEPQEDESEKYPELFLEIKQYVDNSKELDSSYLGLPQRLGLQSLFENGARF